MLPDIEAMFGYCVHAAVWFLIGSVTTGIVILWVVP